MKHLISYIHWYCIIEGSSDHTKLL